MKNHKIFKSLILLALASGITLGVSAQDNAKSKEKDIPDYQLGTFYVYGDRYKIRSRLANKIPTAEKYTPATVNTVDEEELEKKNARTIQDALSDETGLIGNYRGDIPFQNYAKIRGMDVAPSNLLVDGMKAYDTGMFIFSPEIYGMEKVEVLRGPSSTFHGDGSPSGVINMQMKAPKTFDYAKGEIRIGTKNEKTITFDINRTNKNNESAMRFVGLLSKKDLFFDQSSNTRVYFAPSFEKQTEKDRFTIKPFYQYDHVDGLKAQPQIKFGNHEFFKIVPDRAYIGKKGWDKFNLKQWGTVYEWEHNFNKNISFHHQGTVRKTTLLSKQTWGFDDGYGGFKREGTVLDLKGDSYGLDQYLRLHKDTDKGSRDTVLGTDWHYEHTYQSGEQWVWRTWEKKDIPDFLSGRKKWVPNDWKVPAVKEVVPAWSREWGAYLSHTEHIGKYHLSGSIRRGLYDVYTSDDVSPLTNFREYATSGQIGIVYELTDEWLPYVHWSSGFRSNMAWDKDKRPLPPTKSDEWEAGVRYESRDGKTKGSISTFKLTQFDVPALVEQKGDLPLPDPSEAYGICNINPDEGPTEDSQYECLDNYEKEYNEKHEKDRPTFDYFERVGKVGSKGIDLKFEKQINPTWNVNLSYSFLIAKVFDDKPIKIDSEFDPNVNPNVDPKRIPKLVGRRGRAIMAEAPKHTFSIQTEKVINQNKKGKWILNAGLRYFGEALDETNTVKIPGAVIYDLGLTYERKNDKFSLQVKNLFDREYYVSLYQDHPKKVKREDIKDIFPIPEGTDPNEIIEDPRPNIGFLGDERTVMFTYSYTW